MLEFSLRVAYKGQGSSIVTVKVVYVVIEEFGPPLVASIVTTYVPGAKPGLDVSRGSTSSSVVLNVKSPVFVSKLAIVNPPF